jgi:hypothetical protein
MYTCQLHSTQAIRSTFDNLFLEDDLNHLAAILERKGLAYVRIDGDNELEERRVAFTASGIPPQLTHPSAVVSNGDTPQPFYLSFS